MALVKNNASADETVQRAIEGLKEIPDEELQGFLDEEGFMEGLDVIDAWDGDKDDNQELEHNKRISERENSKNFREHHNKESIIRDERKSDERRDPSKSSKDIERDKLRTKKDSDSKLLAEKEKAIKTLLDSDDVVPPGTENEIIQSLTEKKNLEKTQFCKRKNREYPLKSNERARVSPYRRRSPLTVSPEHRRSPYRRSGYDRKPSLDRRSTERRRRRDDRRRSRSRERMRSRSGDRVRRRISRSPDSRRYSPRRRSHTRSRSRSPERRLRKRSPFINELARQLNQEPSSISINHLSSSRSQFNISSNINNIMTYPTEHRLMTTYAPTYVSPVTNMPITETQFVNNYDASLMNFEPPPMHPMLQVNSSQTPVMYNHLKTVAPAEQRQHSPMISLSTPQPVPPPVSIDFGSFQFDLPKDYETTKKKRIERSISPIYSKRSNEQHTPQEERVKTPDPPIISNSQLCGKTSLSSLLEASVSAKDSTGSSIYLPGCKPEIIRQCKHALSELPHEDPRLKISGRFFFDPSKEHPLKLKESKSNSLLLKKNTITIDWEEERYSNERSKTNKMYDKINDTLYTKSVQANPTMVDAEVQVNIIREEQRQNTPPISNKFNWRSQSKASDYANTLKEGVDNLWKKNYLRKQDSFQNSLDLDYALRNSDTHSDSPLDQASINYDFTVNNSHDNNKHDRKNAFGHLESLTTVTELNDKIETRQSYLKDVNWFSRRPIKIDKSPIPFGGHEVFDLNFKKF